MTMSKDVVVVAEDLTEKILVVKYLLLLAVVLNAIYVAALVHVDVVGGADGGGVDSDVDVNMYVSVDVPYDDVDNNKRFSVNY